jgi:hypothetical protein
MSRRWCIPGVLFLLAATVLSALVSVGLPYLTVFDIARVHLHGAANTPTLSGVNEYRVSRSLLSSYPKLYPF